MFKFHQNRNEINKKMIAEKELEKYVDSDFQCLSHLPVKFGAVGDHYCQCGRKRSVYPCEFANLLYANVGCGGRRETSSDNILKIDQNTVFLTKKNLMMSQFLEYPYSTPPPPPTSMKNAKTELNNKIPWLHLSPAGRSRLAIRSISKINHAAGRNQVTGAEYNHRANTSSNFCALSSPLLDKRIVSLLRGITLYWFICLNTVLVKSELIKKKSTIALASDINCDSVTVLLDAISATNSTTVPPFYRALAEFQLSLNLLENACDPESDILLNLFRDSFIEQSRLLNHTVVVLPFDQHSKNNFFEQFVYRLVSNLIAMWRNEDQMPGPSQYCPYNMPGGANQDRDYLDIKVLRNCRLRSDAIHRKPYEKDLGPWNTSISQRWSANPCRRSELGNNEQQINVDARAGSPLNLSRAMQQQNETTSLMYSISPPNHTLQMSYQDLWKYWAVRFGDPETNAAFANDAANNHVDGARMPIDLSPVQSAGLPDEYDQRAELMNARHYGIRIVDPQRESDDENLSRIPTAESFSGSSPEIDPVGDLSPVAADTFVGDDWSCHRYQSASAGAYADDYFNVHQPLDSRFTSANPATTPGNYESVDADRADPNSYRRRKYRRFATRLQYFTADSPSAPDFAVNLSGARANASSSGGHPTSTFSSDFHSPRLSSAIGSNETSARHETSASEPPVESADHGRRSALLAANNSGANRQGEAPNNESDDSELVALTQPDAHPLPSLEEFLPQGILGGGQQCAEFNMWRTPWVNSVQLLRQKPHQPRIMNENDGEQPQIDVVNSRRSQLADSPQPPAASVASLLPTSIQSDVSEYNLWRSPQIVKVEDLSGMERMSTEASDTASNPTPSHDVDVADISFPTFVPVIRGHVEFSDRGAFHYYRRQPPLPNRDISKLVQMQFHFKASKPRPDCADDPVKADKKVRMRTDDDPDQELPSEITPVVPAFKVLQDVQPPMLRSASGLQYQQSGRHLFVFKHELDAPTNNRFVFQPKYAVSPNNKACQTEPDMAYSPPARDEPSPAVRVASPRLSPNFGAPQWPSPHPYQPRQVTPQQPWLPYQAASAAPTAQPWPPAQLPPTSQPMPAFWGAVQQPDPQSRATEPLQYYSLNDVFSHLGQPGLANVGE